jgi:hypothetical protein
MISLIRRSRSIAGASPRQSGTAFSSSLPTLSDAVRCAVDVQRQISPGTLLSPWGNAKFGALLVLCCLTSGKSRLSDNYPTLLEG